MEVEVKADIMKQYETRHGLATVDSNTGITNLHFPSNVFIDDKVGEVKCVIPDRSYAGVYDTIVKNCQQKGQFDYTTTGHFSNVDLMAEAEEYGSHDKTFKIASEGTVTVTDNVGNNIFETAMETGDIWRMCKVKDIPIPDNPKKAAEEE